MNAPVAPKHTCPDIDAVIKEIDAAYGIADECADAYGDQAGDFRNIRHELRGVTEKLEKLRQSNSDLRDCYEYWSEKAEEIDADLLAERDRLKALNAELAAALEALLYWDNSKPEFDDARAALEKNKETT